MGANASRVQNTPDYDASVVLRSGADAAEVATVIEASLSLKELRTAWWHNYEIPHGKIVIDIEVLTLNLSTNTYSIDILVDDVASMNDTPVQVASIPVAAVGVYQIVIDSAKIPLLDTDHSGLGKWIASRVTVGGSADSPSIKYAARMAKSLRA